MAEGIDLDESPGPFDRMMGLRLTHAAPDRVEATLPITSDLLQAHGIVHGGVYCAAIETVASVGASLRAGLEHQVVGISNRTNFLRATRSGTLTITGTPASNDPPRQLWDVDVVDESGRRIAAGQVHLMRLDASGAG